jgi:HEPN domain-containing protein
MPFDGSPENDPREWLRFARSDLEIVRLARSPDVMVEGLCFHAQQAVEKSIKGVLVALGVDFPKVHNIGVLLALLPETAPTPPNPGALARLTAYAVIGRYPGDFEPVSDEQCREAESVAESVLAWAASVIKQPK